MENSKIEWCHHTFNPWVGCTKVSAACKFCYAEEWDKRFHGGRHWGPKADRRITSDATWNEPHKWNRQAEKEGVRKRVFCASLADVFEDHPEIQPAWREVLFELIEQTPWLDWMLLTKRPENVRKMVPTTWEMSFCSIHVSGERRKMTYEEKEAFDELVRKAYARHNGPLMGWPANCWIGTTVENQEEADKRIPYLLQIPAPVRFLSCEPLLDFVEISSYAHGLQLVIAGGESGPNARPMHPDWARGLRDQCIKAGVSFFFKQWGEWYTTSYDMLSKEAAFRQFRSQLEWEQKADTRVRGGQCLSIDGTICRIGKDFMTCKYPVVVMDKVGKKAAGRLLDGIEWNEMPNKKGGNDE